MKELCNLHKTLSFLTILFFTFPFVQASDLPIITNTSKYVTNKVHNNDIVLMGITHKKPLILSFIKSIISDLASNGVTHIGLEIPSDQQDKINHYLRTGRGLMDIKISSQIECNEYRDIFIVIRSMSVIDVPAVVALDLPRSQYDMNISRNEYMAGRISEIFIKENYVKFFAVLGNLHVLKKLDWEEHIPNPHRSIPYYINESLPALQIFSIGQLIDENPDECDFTKTFHNNKNSVALNCNEKYKGWKFAFNSVIAIKQTEVYELLDGLIVY